MKEKQRKDKRKKQRNRLQAQELVQQRLERILVPVYVHGIILNLVIRDCIIDDDTGPILPLAIVSKRWFDIVKNVLQSSRSSNLLPKFSNAAHLLFDKDMYSKQPLAYPSTDFRTFSQLSKDVVEALEKYVLPKIQELKVRPFRDNTINRQLLALPMPALEHLRIQLPSEKPISSDKPTHDIFEVLIDMNHRGKVVSPKYLANLKSIEFISVFPLDEDQCARLFRQCQSVESVGIFEYEMDHSNPVGFETVVSTLLSLPRLTKLSLNRFGPFYGILPTTITSISVGYGDNDGDNSQQDLKDYVLNSKQLESVKGIDLDQEWIGILVDTKLKKIGLVISDHLQLIDDTTSKIQIFPSTLESLTIDRWGDHDPNTFRLEKLNRLRKLVIRATMDSCGYLTHLITQSKSLRRAETSIRRFEIKKDLALLDAISSSLTFKQFKLDSVIPGSFFKNERVNPRSNLVYLKVGNNFTITNTNNHY
ncbi:hypothetical protein DFA_00166 [Cavenderia fasciculata]|uniref:Uncharacterized protein n=1 Tax=Cavenderia fasciculata TaxID=261658 RepID=F4PXS8_CACFS|nr:uncharacterized protein DFA_00166 [Cavenderia fasciculata]EGG19588.1 hypothetical protein DFA_00166 [Cavenderia fasciculata]|eukprot:XP_004357882.1 hypothetical protein DFA_00166 [Cavenderia fasciculata]